MGMSASQARLLSLTSRLHDIEISAQYIEAQKIALATQEDEVYENYCRALDASKIQVAFMQDARHTFVDASYSSVCEFQENRIQQFALRANKTGHLLVSEDIKEAWDKYGNDKYAFAFAALGFKGNFAGTSINVTGCSLGVGNASLGDNYKSGEDGFYLTEDGFVISETPSNNNYTGIMTKEEFAVFSKHSGNGQPTLGELLKNITNTSTDEEQKIALETFRKNLYLYDSEIYEEMKQNQPYNDLGNKDYEDIKPKLQYYLNLWDAINQADGCESIPVTYTTGKAGNEWFNNMVNSGLVSILELKHQNTKNAEWTETSVATSYGASNLIEVQNDENLKKAEAEYEHEMKMINRKDAEFDKELSKLEAERTAITTEVDQIKKMRDENAEKTFGIFS